LMGEEFVAWANSDENDRAPGGTCLSGCRNFARGASWRDAGVKGSKGCGAAMRAAPIGLYLANDDAALVRVSAAQSVITHSHPTGVASSVAAAAPVAWMARGKGLDGLLDFTKQCVAALTDDMLIDLGCEPSAVERIGTREMMRALEKTEAALGQDTDDVCQLLGGAWIGEEAVACAIWCVLKSNGKFENAVLRGANSSGDSDSISCIAGSIVGAMVGVEGIRPSWLTEVEASARLDTLARELHSAASSGVDKSLLPDLDFFGAERQSKLELPVQGDLFE
jgi:ADP-ribosylglycohydrolase